MDPLEFLLITKCVNDFYEHEPNEIQADETLFSSIDKMSVTIEFSNNGSHLNARQDFSKEQKKLIVLSALTNNTLCTIFDIKNAKTSIDMANIVKESENGYEILELLFPEKLCEIAALNENFEKLEEYISEGFICDDSVINSAIMYDKAEAVNFLVAKGFNYNRSEKKRLRYDEENNHTLPVVGRVDWIDNFSHEEIKQIHDFFERIGKLEFLLQKNLKLLTVTTASRDRIEIYKQGLVEPNQHSLLDRSFRPRSNPIDSVKLEKAYEVSTQMLEKLQADNILINDKIKNEERKASKITRAIYASKNVRTTESYELIDQDIVPYVAILIDDQETLASLLSKENDYDRSDLADFARKINRRMISHILKKRPMKKIEN